MDEDTAATFTVIGAQSTDPSDHGGNRVRPAARRDGRTELHEGVPARVALAIPGPAPTDCHLDLYHRLEPVDVRPVQQADLDQSHRAGRIATQTGA